MLPRTPPRLTRKESRNVTREKLLAAARREVAHGGVRAISLRRLCEAAGFSQGAFYSNFADRDALLLELMEQHVHAEISGLRSLIALNAQASFDEALRQLAVRLAELAQAQHWSLLAVELQLHAQRDAKFAARYACSKSHFHKAFAAALQQLFDLYGLKPSLPCLQIAIGLYALWCGLAVQGATPPSLPHEEILPREKMFLAFLRAIVGLPAPSIGANAPTSGVQGK